MGKRGPRPTPIEQLHTWRGKKKDQTPKPAAGVPEPPDWFGEQALQCWWHTCAELRGMNLLWRSDRNALVRYCEMWSQWLDADRVCREAGMTMEIETKRGTYVMQRPEVSIARNLALELRRLEQEFGMTPSARARIVVPEKEHDVGMEGALFG